MSPLDLSFLFLISVIFVKIATYFFAYMAEQTGTTLREDLKELFSFNKNRL